MSAHFWLNLSSELGKVIECEACRALILLPFRNEFNKEHECKILFIT